MSRDFDDSASIVIIAVGEEILSGHTLDTDSILLARAVFAAGIRRAASRTWVMTALPSPPPCSVHPVNSVCVAS